MAGAVGALAKLLGVTGGVISLVAVVTSLAAAMAAIILLLVLARDHLLGRMPISLDSLFARVGPFVLLTTLAVMAIQALDRPYSLWDDPRLAMTMAISHGHRLYAPPSEGPQLTTIYGPVGPIMYLPAMVAKRPDIAMIIAGMLAQIYFFTPVAIVCFRGIGTVAGNPGGYDGRTSLLLFCAAVLFCAASASLGYSAFRIHVDAPALGFAGLACVVASEACAHPARWSRTLAWMTGVGILATLAVFTKQTLLPVVPAIAVAIAIRRGLASAAVFVGLAAVTAGVMLGLLGEAFGFSEMVFHAISVPSSHPYDKSLQAAFPWGVGECLPLLVVPLFLITIEIGLRSGDAAASRVLGASMDGLRIPFLLAAVLCAPTAVLGFIKQGGAVNNWSVINYFLLLAVVSLTRRCLSFGKDVFGVVSKALLIATASCLCCEAALSGMPKQVMHMRRPSPTSLVFDYCRSYPGRAYFPWHPSAVLAAEGKLHHFYYAVYDRALAGKPISPRHFSDYTPSENTYMFFDTEGVLDEHFFSDFIAAYEVCDGATSPPSPIDGMVFTRRVPAAPPVHSARPGTPTARP